MADNHKALAEQVGTKQACSLVGLARATHYRRRKPKGPASQRAVRMAPPNALCEAERVEVRSVLHAPEHCDLAVAQVWARVLDDGTYLCSQATMHRILRAAGEGQDRRGQRTHPAKKIPELMARQPNQVWSWDITKLKGPAPRIYYDLYVVLDIYSRYVVNWLLAAIEDAELAKALLEDAIVLQGVNANQLTIHADRGGAMRSKPVSQLLVDLGVVRSHSRPHVSRRQPVLRGAVQDDQVLLSVPRALRFNRAGPRLLRRLLRPLQPRPPPLGHRATHTSLGPLRHRHRDPSQAPSHPQRGLRGQPNTFPQQGTTRPSTPRGRLDQSTPRRGNCTEQLDGPCLIRLDRFRCGQVTMLDTSQITIVQDTINHWQQRSSGDQVTGSINLKRRHRMH